MFLCCSQTPKTGFLVSRPICLNWVVRENNHNLMLKNFANLDLCIAGLKLRVHN